MQLNYVTYAWNTSLLKRRNRKNRMMCPACYGSDIFEYRSHHYLLVADYFSKFPVVKKLTNQTAGHLISILQTIFSEYGVPPTVNTYQGTQFVSQEFKQFALQYRLEVQHSSPTYPPSNGFIEAMVKVVKGIMAKAEDSVLIHILQCWFIVRHQSDQVSSAQERCFPEI